MKRSKTVLLTLPVLLIFGLCFKVINTPTVDAHPGNTAADGCHYCWTNCAYWGEVYGERHCHGGGGGYSSGPTYYEQGQDNGYDHAVDTNRDYIEENAQIEGQKDGYDDGTTGNGESVDPDSDICDEDVEFSSAQPEEYMDSFQEAYSEACYDIYSDAYAVAYSSSYSDGEEAILAQQKSETETEADEIVLENNKATKDYTGWIIVGILVLGWSIYYLGNEYGEDIAKWWKE